MASLDACEPSIDAARNGTSAETATAPSAAAAEEAAPCDATNATVTPDTSAAASRRKDMRVSCAVAVAPAEPYDGVSRSAGLACRQPVLQRRSRAVSPRSANDSI